jgi:hypothetical protein
VWEYADMNAGIRMGKSTLKSHDPSLSPAPQ